MVRIRKEREDPPDPGMVLGALVDDDCRTILNHLDVPRTAAELSEACDIPLSTTYRKLGRMVEATLLEEITEIRDDGQHTTRYRINFTEVTVDVDEDGSLEISISRPVLAADERLAYLWTEVKKEL